MIPQALGISYTVKAIWLAILGVLFLSIGAIGVVQTVRIEGLKVWPIHIEGWKPKAERYGKDLDALIVAQMQAKLTAIEAKAETEKQYRDLAKEIDDDAKAKRENELARADRFIASGLRAKSNRGPTSGSVATPTDNSAGNGDSAGEAPIVDDANRMVLVEDEDVLICTVNTLQAEAAREWALGLMANPNQAE